MSKRYGRNQRRRAREALADEQARVQTLEQARAKDSSLLTDQSHMIHDLRARLADIANQVGHHAVIAGEPSTLSGGFDGMRMAPVKPVPTIDIRGPVLEEITCEILRLLEIEAIHDVFSRAIHFRVSLAGGSSAYAISEYAIYSMPSKSLEYCLVPEIAKELARCLANVLNTKSNLRNQHDH